MLSPPILCQNPWPIRHRRLVTHMLTMAALEVGHPITILVHMISDNGLMHAHTSRVFSLSIFEGYVTLARMLTRTQEHAS